MYGALPENPYYMDEAFPLNSSRTYPEMRDLAEMDMLATAYLWRSRRSPSRVLRPVNVLGYHVRSAIGRYLRRERVPTVMGFNPMMQFIHEDDVAEAIVLAIECADARRVQRRRPRRRAAARRHPRNRRHGAAAARDGRAAGDLRPLFRWGLYPFPPRAIDFAKYQCTLDGTRFREATGFTPRFSLRRDLRRGARVSAER